MPELEVGEGRVAVGGRDGRVRRRFFTVGLASARLAEAAPPHRDALARGLWGSTGERALLHPWGRVGKLSGHTRSESDRSPCSKPLLVSFAPRAALSRSARPRAAGARRAPPPARAADAWAAMDAAARETRSGAARAPRRLRGALGRRVDAALRPRGAPPRPVRLRARRVSLSAAFVAHAARSGRRRRACCCMRPRTRSRPARSTAPRGAAAARLVAEADAARPAPAPPARRPRAARARRGVRGARSPPLGAPARAARWTLRCAAGCWEAPRYRRPARGASTACATAGCAAAAGGSKLALVEHASERAARRWIHRGGPARGRVVSARRRLDSHASTRRGGNTVHPARRTRGALDGEGRAGVGGWGRGKGGGRVNVGRRTATRAGTGRGRVHAPPRQPKPPKPPGKPPGKPPPPKPPPWPRCWPRCFSISARSSISLRS